MVISWYITRQITNIHVVSAPWGFVYKGSFAKPASELEHAWINVFTQTVECKYPYMPNLTWSYGMDDNYNLYDTMDVFNYPFPYHS